MARKPKKVLQSSRRRSKQTPKASPILPPPASLDATKLKQLYTIMLGCRMMAERARLLVSQGVFPRDISVITGHEAPEVGALVNLVEEDCVASGRREYMARFIQGAHLRRIFAELCARQAGVAEGRRATNGANGHVDMMVPCSSFNAQLNLVTGAAWAFKLHRKPQVAVSFYGDNFSSTDSWREVVRFSAAYQLPLVHIVEDHGGNEADGTKPAGPSQEAGAGAGPGSQDNALPCFVVDGSDVVAVYRVTQEAIRRARQGHGPALIECRVSAAGSPLRTADADSSPFEDPLSKMEAHLRWKGLWSDKWKAKLVQRFTRDLDRASAFATRTSKSSRRLGTDAPASGSPAGSNGKAETDTSNLETAVIRDTARLAGSRR
jgi:TPP-dependent pyruvate/acetoin dehydrogenase alpha subunit